MEVIDGAPSFLCPFQPQDEYSSPGVRAAVAAGSLPATRPLDLASHYLSELRTAEAKQRQMQRSLAAKSGTTSTGISK